VKEQSWTVLGFAVFVGVWVLLAGFFHERMGGVDELGLFNPSYMVSYYGELTYPIHGYVDKPVIVHPPVHTGVIGLLGRMGFTWYYAEATPTVFFLLLSVIFVVRGAFSLPAKLGLLFAIALAAYPGRLPFVAHWPYWCEIFGTRPEGHIQAAWMAGLIILENARLKGWPKQHLFWGAAVLTWAATLHYYAWPAVLGIVVYAILILHSSGWLASRSQLVALSAGACLVGIPYLVFYLIPYREQVLAAIKAQGSGGIAESIKAHFEIYGLWAHSAHAPLAIRIVVWSGVPVMLFMPIVFGFVRCLRGMVLAAAPWQICLFFFASHKLGSYLTHEALLSDAALCAGVLTAAMWLVARMERPIVSKAIPICAAITLAACLVVDTGLLDGGTRIEPRVHEADLARAASRQILGREARVASRLGAWYTSGAAVWHDTMVDLLARPKSYDPAVYFGQFDALADYFHRSNDKLNGDHTLSSWYAEGLLKLRGFFWGESGPDMQLLYFQLNPPSQVIGYVARRGELGRFEEDLAGDHTLVSAACESITSDRADEDLRASGIPHGILQLPQSGVLVTTLTPRGLATLPPWMTSCRQVNAIQGRMSSVNKSALIAELRRDKGLVHFAQRLEDVPGYRGMPIPAELLPPTDVVRLDHVLDFEKLHAINLAKMERVRTTLVTDPRPGAFSAMVPIVGGASLTVPCWIKLRLQVNSGSIGILLHDGVDSTVVGKAALTKTTQPVDIALPADSLAKAKYVMLFNADWSGASRVEILDATVLVRRADWLSNVDTFAKLR
jgi:hypothetical protein